MTTHLAPELGNQLEAEASYFFNTGQSYMLQQTYALVDNMIVLAKAGTVPLHIANDKFHDILLSAVYDFAHAYCLQHGLELTKGRFTDWMKRGQPLKALADEAISQEGLDKLSALKASLKAELAEGLANSVLSGDTSCVNEARHSVARQIAELQSANKLTKAEAKQLLDSLAIANCLY